MRILEIDHSGPDLLDVKLDQLELADHSGDSDDEDDQISPAQAEELSKRRAHRDAFQQFLSEADEKEQSETAAAAEVEKEAEESAKIIDKARDYQQDLFERAKEENVITVLDTGSGKTLIAALLVRYMLDKELMERSSGQPPKFIFFLVNRFMTPFYNSPIWSELTACSVHLVRQQARVLANNLSRPPAALYGSGKDDLWKKVNWDEILKNNDAVVCTAEILSQCLMKSFLKIEQISLIVFDECHHAKKDHPYAKIMWEYHMRQKEPTIRPKIFGMTASPVNAKVDINKAMDSLEALLHAKIVTTTSISLFEHAPRARNEEWTYDRLRLPFETDLCRAIREVCEIAELNDKFVFSKLASCTLGRWPADRVWFHALSENAALKLEKDFENSKAYISLETTEKRERALRAIAEAAALVRKHKFAPPKATLEDLSPKVMLLCQELTRRYAKDPGLRSMVFVNQRLTAETLCDCFRQFRIPNLRPSLLLGVNQAGQSLDSQAASPQNQEKIMEYFQAGLVNCVFSTSVGEEGIDAPQCSLVIRFDLFSTPIQYMQSRGRARMKNSIFAIMLEEDNFDHRDTVDYALQSEEYIKEFCAKLPKDRLLGHTNALARMIAKAGNDQRFVTQTGASCSYGNSLLILSRYASSLQHQGSLASDVSYELYIKDNVFRHKVKLPEESPIPGVVGDYKPNKQLAKRSAAWKCCYVLRGKGLLDENLDSIYVRRRPENANAHLKVSGKKHKYEMKVKPDFWNIGERMPSVLYATVIRFEPTEKLARELSTLVLLSRSALPPLPVFSVYLDNNTRTEVVSTQIPHEFSVDTEMTALLTKFTLNGIFADVFNKIYELDSAKVSYWLAPAKTARPSSSRGDLKEFVDMQAIHAVQNGRIVWEPGMSAGLWQNKFLVDPKSGKYHYFTKSTAPDATIHSPVPESAMNVVKKGKKNVLDFTDSHWRLSKKKVEHLWDVDQPVFEAELLSVRRDVLDRASDKELKNAAVNCLIAPQPLEVSPLSISCAASCMIWPAILHRIESYLIALEGFAKINIPITADLALEAFTKDSNTGDHEHQVHTGSERGMGKNYERLEFIGDSLLKMTTTMTVFCLHSAADELGMHVARMLILCNQNLFNVSVDDALQLFRYARTSGFNRRTWYPEGLVLLKGTGVKAKAPDAVKHPETTHDLGEKTIADISEAMIGAAIMATRDQPNKFDLAIQTTTKLVASKDHPITRWSDIPPLYKVPAWQIQCHDPIANDLAATTSKRTGYTFRHPRLLRSALTHTSDMTSPVPDYQRLEFLGDSVLDMVCINWMFQHYPDKNPQWLTEHKMAMVSNKFLACLAVDLGFDKLIRATTVALLAQVNDYSIKVREALAPGKDNIARDFWTHIDNPPKALSDLIESYIGALTVDSSFAYSLAEDFFTNHILWYFADLELYSTFANRHPTSYLYQKLTDEYKCHDYTILSSEPKAGEVEVSITAGVVIHGTVVSSDTGTSSKYAKVRASKACLKKLDGLTIADFRREYNCTCRAGE